MFESRRSRTALSACIWFLFRSAALIADPGEYTACASVRVVVPTSVFLRISTLPVIPDVGAAGAATKFILVDAIL